MQMKGIDVSSYQGDIDFEQVKNGGIDFVIIKAGEWNHTVDKFEEYYEQAKAAGLHIGFYWFCDGETISEISQEADACIKALKDKQFDFPIYMDLENQYQYDLGKEFCSEAVRTFCGKLEKAGYFTGLYTSTSWLDSVIEQDIKDKYTIWVADWRGYCGYDGNYGIWQYGAGYVPGINGKTDLNIIDIGYSTDYPGVILQDGVDLDYAYEDFPSIIVPNGFNNYPKSDENAWENDPCRDVANTLDIKGVTPVLSGDKWFLIDQTCTFTLETLPYANVNIYLVGGGEDGAEWFREDENGKEVYKVAKKSRGGCVLKKQIYITGNVECKAFVAEANNPTGTSVVIGKDIYKCTDNGYIHRKATSSGNAYLEKGGNFNAESGANGISTPYGYVGSSGGGGGTYSIQNYQYIEVFAGSGGSGAGDGGNVRQNGSNATNYGCGGGAAGFGGFQSDGDVVETHGGLGMPGCVIFEILDSGTCDNSPNKPTDNNCNCYCVCSHHKFDSPESAESSSSCTNETITTIDYTNGEPIITTNSTNSSENSDNSSTNSKNYSLSEYSENTNVQLISRKFSIAVSDWKSLSSEINNCKYYAEIIITDITENDNVYVSFSFDSMPICNTAGIYSVGETENEKIIIYSKEIPSDDINGVYTFQKKVSDNNNNSGGNSGGNYNNSSCGCTSNNKSNSSSCSCGHSNNSRCTSYDVQKWGENWLLFDESGEYSLTMDSDVNMTVYLVGGGSDGEDGIYYNKTAYGGDGGNGGCINVVRDIAVPKGQTDITVTIGERENYGGTSIIINNYEYSCNSSGNTINDGGFQGISGKYAFRNAGNGTNGIETPFGYVGSSGGGGAAYCNGSMSGYGKGGLYAGNGGKIINGKSTTGDKATGYGCGGGGGAASSTSWCKGGKGKRGCVIITWDI